jgi:nucleotide-binding universal stress UspA family protein
LIAPALGSPAPPAVDVGSATDTVRAALDDALRPWTERHPDVAVRRLPVVGGATRALVEASSEAALVVVGSRGHGALAGTLFGSVSRHLLRQAHCPVAVVRD